MRKYINFNENWEFEKNKEFTAVQLPHCWNAVDGQDGGNDYYRGNCVYRKRFLMPQISAGQRVYLELEGASAIAKVMLNGKLLCCHEGGYSTFRTDLTDALDAENLLEISVDNSPNSFVYPQKADFTFYG